MVILSCDEILHRRLLPGIWDEIQKSNAEKEQAGVTRKVLILCGSCDSNYNLLNPYDQSSILRGYAGNGFLVDLKVVDTAQKVADAIKNAGPFLEILHFIGHGVDSHYGDNEGAIFLGSRQDYFNSSSVPSDIWEQKSFLKSIRLQACSTGNLARALSNKIPKVSVIASYALISRGNVCTILCSTHNYPELRIVHWYSKKPQECIFKGGSSKEPCGLNFAHWYKEEKDFFKKRIEKELEDPRIHSVLADLHMYGEGDSKDLKQAYEHLRLSAGNLETPYDPSGPYDPFDMTTYGLWLSTGRGCEKSIDEAKKWYLKASEAGSFIASYHLGMLFLDEAGILPEGKEKEAKEAEAVKYLDAAARENHAPARAELALYRFLILIRRLEEQKAAIEKVRPDSGDLNDWARELENITGVIKWNRSIALGHLEQAIRNEDADAFYCAGRLHFTGNASEKYDQSDKKAFAYFERAAKSGSKRALYFMGVFYKEGYAPCQKSIDEAIKWFTRDMEEYGKSEAAYELALLYLQKQKQEGSKNLESKGKQVLDWLTNAAITTGWLSANHLLGRLYSRGEAVYGIEPSEDMAKKFFDFVEKNQNEAFKKIKEDLDKEIDQALQLSQANETAAKEEETEQLNKLTGETATSSLFDDALVLDSDNSFR